jgi:hypothetical protein
MTSQCILPRPQRACCWVAATSLFTLIVLASLAPVRSFAADQDLLKITNAQAKTEAEMKRYAEVILNT